MKVKLKFRLWLTFASLVAFLVILSGCAEYSATTPTPASQSQTSKTTIAIAQSSATAQVTTSRPAVTPGQGGNTTSSATQPATNRNTEPTSKPLPPTIGPRSGGTFTQLPFADSSYYVHIPATLPLGQPAQVVLAIHGMSNNGLSFAEPLVSYADHYNMILVAPNMKYDSNYVDANRVAANDEILLPELQTLVAELPNQLHLALNPKILLFGFSRGAQIVHRFAFFYPQMVLGVAALSAGNYTLPTADFQAANSAQNRSNVALPYPFGIADFNNYAGHNFDLASLQQIPFWLAVGGADNITKDVPPAWSPYLGQTRLERTTHFYETLQRVGIPATLTVVPGVGHQVCTEMKQGAFNFFAKLIA